MLMCFLTYRRPLPTPVEAGAFCSPSFTLQTAAHCFLFLSTVNYFTKTGPGLEVLVLFCFTLWDFFFLQTYLVAELNKNHKWKQR